MVGNPDLVHTHCPEAHLFIRRAKNCYIINTFLKIKFNHHLDRSLVSLVTHVSVAALGSKKGSFLCILRHLAKVKKAPVAIGHT